MRTRLLAASAIVPAIAFSGMLPATAAPAAPASSVTALAPAAQAGQTAGMQAAATRPIAKASTTGLKCSGKLLTRKSAYLNGKTVGVLYVWINDRNHGTAYACFSHAGITKGKRAATSVVILGTNTRTAKKPAVTVKKAVVTNNLAGVVAVKNVKVLNHCINAAGAIKWAGKTVTVESGSFCYVRVYK